MARTAFLHSLIIEASFALLQNALTRLGHRVASSVVSMGQNDILAQSNSFAPFVDEQHYADHEKHYNNECQHFHMLNMSIWARYYKIGALTC